MYKSLRISALLALFLFIVSCAKSGAENEKSTLHNIVVDGVERSYRLYVPPGVNSLQNVSLMLVLHGGLGNASSIEKTTGMNEIADSSQFIVAYPNGMGGRFGRMKKRRTWNAGHCCGPAQKRNSSDVLFIQKVIDDIQLKFSIDSRRIYVTGMSNGAMMAYRLACEIPDRIAAIIPVSGTIEVGNCDGAKDIPVLHIHGDQDKNVPFGGGKGSHTVSGIMHTSVNDTMNLITRPRQCTAPDQKNLNNNVQLLSYNCGNGASVELMIIKGGGHVWPGGQSRGKRGSGNKSVTASQVAWDFAKEHSKALPAK